MTEFAKQKGCSLEAVRKAMESGRLSKSIIQVPGAKKPKLDPILAAQEWERNTDHTKRTVGADLRMAAPPALNPTPLSGTGDPEIERLKKAVGPKNEAMQDLLQNRAEAEAVRLKLLQIELEEKTGSMVPLDAVRHRWVKLITESKTKILSLPSKIKAAIPALTLDQLAAIDRLVRESLEDLSNASD